MITAYVGLPGEGKTYCLTRWMYQQMRRGRAGFSQYAVHGARPLEMIGDLLHDNCIGAAVALDEVGRILPARDWTNEDEIEALVFEIHRHHGLDIGYAVQSPSQVSASLRRLTGEWIFPTRIGPDPSKLLKAGKVPRWYQRPWLFELNKYFPDPSDESGMPRIVKKKISGSDKEDYNDHIPCEHSWIVYHSYISAMYDTTERLCTDAMQLEIEERLKTAPARLSKPPWEVINGHTIGGHTRLMRARDDEKIRARQQRGRRSSRRIRIEAQPEDEYSTFDLSQYFSSLQRDAAANEETLRRAASKEDGFN